MKQRIRKRWILKWLGVSMILVIGAIWSVNLRSGMCYDRVFLGQEIEFCDGCFVFWGISDEAASRWFPEPASHYSKWWPQRRRKGVGSLGPTMFFYNNISNPIYLLIPPILLGTVLLFIGDRGHSSGCRKCGYNLTGNVSGVCPECGVRA